VAANDGAMPQTREHIILAPPGPTSPYIVVALNKVDMVGRRGVPGAGFELDLRELLSRYEFPGDDNPDRAGPRR